MANTQSVMWTALPNGVQKDLQGKTWLKLSVFVSPQLTAEVMPSTLGTFPEFSGGTGANWASTVNALTFEAQVSDSAGENAKVIRGVKVVSADAEPGLWDKFFPGTTLLTKSRLAITETPDVRSFSVAAINKAVNNQWIGVLANPKLAFQTPTAKELVAPPGMTTLPLVNVLSPAMRPNIRITKPVSGLQRSMAVEQTRAFQDLEDFHKPFESLEAQAMPSASPNAFPGQVGEPNKYKVPPPPPPFKKPPPPLDFHTAVSMVGQYPKLLPRLGLVIDLEIPYDSTLNKNGRIRIIPLRSRATGTGVPSATRTAGGVTMRDTRAWTVYALDTVGTGSRTIVKGFTAATGQSYLKDGYLVMRNPAAPSKSPVSVLNMDADYAGVALKSVAVDAAMAIKEMATNPAQAAAEKTDGKMSAQSIDTAIPLKTTAAAVKHVALPALGVSVMSIAVNNAGARLESRIANAARVDKNRSEGKEDLVINHMEELVRGYSIDVWDSVTKQWHKLCGRTGKYKIGDYPITWKDGADSLTDEGWIQIGVTSNPATDLKGNPPKTMWLHESLFDWKGWSLAVSRPGAPLSPPDENNISSAKKTFEKGGETHAIGSWIDPSFPLSIDFSVPPGTLPRKRYGVTYRFRARAIDLAGHGVAFLPGNVLSDPGGPGDRDVKVSDKVTNRRLHPVTSPTVVITESLAGKSGETPHGLVVRSNYDTPPASIAPTSRHIAPPRSSIELAEELGGFDKTTDPNRPVDALLWATLAKRDDWDFPTDPVKNEQTPIGEIKDETTGKLPYLPDMLSRGAAFLNLPGSPKTGGTMQLQAIGTPGTSPNAVAKGAVVPITATKSETVTTVQVAFDATGEKWYDKRPFKLVVKGIEANDARLAAHAAPAKPAWDSTNRVLTVELPKADKVEVELSSYTNPADLNLMATYEMAMRPHVYKTSIGKITAQRAMAAAVASPLPTSTKATMTRNANALVSVAQIGRMWAVTPAEKLTLVHAVQQPLIAPAFTSSAYAERRQGETFAKLIDWMPISGKSTAKLDVTAKWNENVDDPASGVPKWNDPGGTDTSVAKGGPAFGITIPPEAKTALDAGRKKPAFVTVKRESPLKAMAGEFVFSPTFVSVVRTLVPAFFRGLKIVDRANPQRHFFGDTKHRKVIYTASAASRFPDYFPAGVDVTRVSAEKPLHVPSSKRPAPPAIAYIIPTFGWTRTAANGTRSSSRAAGGLRVYLERPWFDSGDDEQLGIVTGTAASNPAKTWDYIEKHVSVWAHDPVFSSSGSLPATLPTRFMFKKRDSLASNILLAEDSATKVGVTGYDVAFDAERDLWYADIEVDPSGAYFPFIKLALVRYQPYSIKNLEISHVVRADFVQLAPGRSASVAWGATGLDYTVSVTGQTYAESYWSSKHPSDAAPRAAMTATLERRATGDETVSAWVPVGGETPLPKAAGLFSYPGSSYRPTYWKKTFPTPQSDASYEWRLVLKEYELFHTVDSTSAVRRLVYADTISLVKP